ncbi:putative RNA-directed DNA polymerase from transposon X-element, partial [Araneus ventricosus]
LYLQNLPSKPVHLNTTLQAVAVQVRIKTLTTVCSIYLPPSQTIQQSELDALVRQLPPPFIILGDWNGHSSFWGSTDSNARGLQIEKLMSDQNLCLLNDSSHTFFHLPTRTFHTLDLALCSPSLVAKWNFNVDNNLYNSDHFPLILTLSSNDVILPKRPSRFIFDKANWQLFQELAELTTEMIQLADINDAVNAVTECIIKAAEASIPKSSGKLKRIGKPWWNEKCAEAKKAQRKAWDRFRRYPTTDNFILFKHAKAIARRIRRQSQRHSFESYVNSIRSRISSKVLWEKVRKMLGSYSGQTISVLNSDGQVISDAKAIADTLGKAFAAVSSEESYPRNFVNLKKQEEMKTISFTSFPEEAYNADFTFQEFQNSLNESHPSSPGPDGIHYHLLKKLNDRSLNIILSLFNRIWNEQVYPVTWGKAFIVPILKVGKDPQEPTNYRPIALTSCLSKLMEKMVNKRLVYILEKKGLLSKFQSGFRYGRGTQDNVLQLETAIREAFITKKHLVSVLFDMEKAYDRSWRYGILKDMYNMGFRGKLPIFIKNFLQTRTFQVRVGDILSEEFIQKEGVPQGSVLSVVLFVIKINGIIHQLPPYGPIALCQSSISFLNAPTLTLYGYVTFKQVLFP